MEEEVGSPRDSFSKGHEALEGPSEVPGRGQPQSPEHPLWAHSQDIWGCMCLLST